MMIGPTGVGKTEIARRLAKLTGAPFIKVEATKYTEVGYYGRDVESMVRELVENAIGLVRQRSRTASKARPGGGWKSGSWICWSPRRRTPMPMPATAPTRPPASATSGRGEKMRAMLAAGELDQRQVEITIEQKAVPMMLTGIGMEQMDIDLQSMFEKILPKNTSRRKMTVADARKVLFEQECDALINKEKLHAAAIELAESLGIIFIDEIDKIVSGEQLHGPERLAAGRAAGPVADRRGDHGPDPLRLREDRPRAVHRRGGLPPRQAQRPDARAPGAVPHPRGAFGPDQGRLRPHPPRAQGRLTKQYQALLATEGVEMVFEDDAVDSLANYASR